MYKQDTTWNIGQRSLNSTFSHSIIYSSIRLIKSTLHFISSET
ncbi:hypothetical protein VDIAB_220144 [Vibrio diabolicus]|nr:hypothetical protein VDIAB_220144 [Vibrio diabolicus]